MLVGKVGWNSKILRWALLTFDCCFNKNNLWFVCGKWCVWVCCVTSISPPEFRIQSWAFQLFRLHFLKKINSIHDGTWLHFLSSGLLHDAPDLHSMLACALWGMLVADFGEAPGLLFGGLYVLYPMCSQTEVTVHLTPLLEYSKSIVH